MWGGTAFGAGLLGAKLLTLGRPKAEGKIQEAMGVLGRTPRIPPAKAPNLELTTKTLTLE